MENKESIKITTSNAIEVLRVINKLNMKDTLVNAIEDISKLDEENNKEFRKLQKLLIKKCGGSEEYLQLSEEEKKVNSNLVLIENDDLNNKLISLKSQKEKVSSSLAYDFITSLPNAEKEVYKVLGKIFNKPIGEIEKQDIGITINMIKNIARSETVQTFFSSATALKKVEII